ncbi:hypothetical protein CHS0354_012929 [Potamilus streckersoni]|uniref:Cytoplasmic FMR1-interacting protein n=1 Tax=Potamilus streckersoni TaxID=2493646 RepID=A0AAE0RNV7_9BIVA|nr:hypothetical protein CHS0354_012929 [Potamilus streckersoni]
MAEKVSDGKGPTDVTKGFNVKGLIVTEGSLKNALETVDLLSQLGTKKPQPCVTALSQAVQYQVDFDTNFEDRGAFVTGVAKFMEEATNHADMNKLLEEGQTYAAMLYTWRCCSRGIPQGASNDQKNRVEVNQMIVDVLQPLITKLMNFMAFHERAIDRFCMEVKRLCHEEVKNDFVSEAYLLTLGKFINMFVELDELKNMKAGLSNDHSIYKRSANFIGLMKDAQVTERSQMLGMFLANKNEIRRKLKVALMVIDGYDELLADVINISVNMYENKMYLEPSEKYMLVKVMAFSVALIDKKKTVAFKKISFSKLDRILKEVEIVPLYGDMQVAIYKYIKDSPCFDISKWSSCESSHPCPQSNLLVNLPAIREDHLSYISQLSRYSTEYSWKLLNPTTENCPATAEHYERSTKYNYSNEEKFALVEVIAMVKGLQVKMSRMESMLTDAIHSHMYAELQNLVQIELREPLRRSVKNNKTINKMVLLSIRDSCVDWLNGIEPPDDPALKGKKDSNEGFPIQVPRKQVGPSGTQLYMVRTMLESIISNKGLAKKSSRKDFDSQSVASMESFHQKSFYWNYLLNFGESLQNCCDLSQLWFREFFLEMTNGGRVQFPIEMSMPWILTDHVLETKESSMMEYILYPLDLYNDSAHYALTKFRQQFLYDEVEAEVNLCFDQFVFKLSEQLFTSFKQMASCIMLDKKLCSDCTQAGIKVTLPPVNRYETLMQQTNVQILGRSVNLRSLVSQRVNTALKNSLDIAISRFETGDLTRIIELEGLIQCNRLAHKLLSKHLILDEFDAMLKEADINVNIPCGRITLHILSEIKGDFLPMYCFNGSTNRFVRTVLLNFSEEYTMSRDKLQSVSAQYIWGSKALGSIYSTVYSPFSGFVGMPHFQAISHLIGYQGIAIIFSELLKFVERLLKSTIQDYLKPIKEAMPQKCGLTLFSYGSIGALSKYYAQLVDIIQHPDLRTETFHWFRVLGNAIVFFLLMEQAIHQEEICDLRQAGAFNNIIPPPHLARKDNESKDERRVRAKKAMDRLVTKYSSLHAINVVSQHGSQKQADIAKATQLLTQEKLCCGLSMFQTILYQIQTFLDDEIWRGKPPENGVINVNECQEFHRLWSAMQFVFCMPVGQNLSIEQLFGEGLNWAGCTLMVLLQQHRRFEVLDFCYHIVKVNRVDMKNDTYEGIELQKMVSRIRKFQLLNTQIFSQLLNHLNRKMEKDMDPNSADMKKKGKDITEPNIINFSPPVYESVAII